jgi:hypothetical protein
MQFRQRHNTILLACLLLSSLALAGCATAQASEDEIKQAWETSAHANIESRAFTNWNENDPAEIPENCAKCHSTTGYLDFLGVDGSTPGTVDKPAPVGTTVECEACHNETSGQKQSAVMPSGIELTDLGKNTNCMECHQGRQSTVSVDEAVAGLDDDEMNEELSFLNIHNSAVGPTQYGTQAKGGYEYEGQTYAGLYSHATGYETCVDCHNPHTLWVTAENCQACHINAPDVARLRNIRMSEVDYDGDGDIDEGISGEIKTMQSRLLETIQLYAHLTKELDDIAYEDRNPYFFDDAGEPYSTWTPSLLRAAYNYQYASKGLGGYVHNNQYIIQLLYDSIDDLGGSTAGMTRPESR